MKVGSSAALAPTHEPRLLPAQELVRDGALDVLSLDAFDTLLLRAVPTPTDAFAVLGHRLVGSALLAPFVTPSLFAEARRHAELRARATRRHRGEFPEVTLDEIYAQLPDSMVAATRGALVDAELAIEADLVFADPEVAGLARGARERDVRIVVVSDTYLSGEQLTGLLDATGLDDLDARVFTSSDHRCGKATGLFDIVVTSLGADPARVLHVGDHEHADLAAAHERGLRAVHLELRSTAFDEVVRGERQFVAEHPDAGAALDPEVGDVGVTAVRARLVAAGAPPEVPEHARAHWRAGAGVLGPVFTGFADWVVERAGARGVTRLACLMREGTLLAPLLSEAAHSRDVALDAVPLWLSRQVCARAAIERGDYSELRVFVERRVAPTLGELCAVLGVAPADLGDLGAHLETRLDDVQLREAAIGTIVGDERVRAGLLERAAELRRRLVRTIDGVRHPDDPALTIVDLGWHATTQRLLVRALSIAGYELSVIGFYLLTTDRLVDAALDGVDAEGFLAHAGDPRSTTDVIVRSPEMLEQLCMGPEGSVLDLDEAGRPRLGATSVAARQLDEAQATRDGILAFGARLRTMLPNTSLAGAADLLRPMLGRFIATPTPDEVTAFGGWSHDDNFGTDTGAMLAQSELLGDGSYADPAALAEVDAYWPAAIVARDAPRSDSNAAMLADGSAPTIGLYADAGAGFDEAHAVHRAVPVNTLGLSYVQLGIAAEGIRALRLDPTSCYALVRIDRIALRLAVRGSSEPVVRTFTTSEELSAWELRDCVWLSGGLLVARTTDPQMLLDLTPHVQGDVYAVLASVAFASMELPESAFGADGEVMLGSDSEHAIGARALRELRAVASEVRAAARTLAADRRARSRGG